jgi:hypothetical protein
MFVGEYLDLDVTRRFEKLLHVDRRIAEGGLGFLPRHCHRVDKGRLGMNDAHATAAPAP